MPSLDPKPLKHFPPTIDEADLALAPEPVTIYGLDGSGGATAVGREILAVNGDTDLSIIPGAAEYTYIDVRNLQAGGNTVITLPRAEDYGAGRILYVNDKLGSVDPETWQPRIRIQAQAGQGIDGKASFLISEKDGFVALRATDPGQIGMQEWQVVAVNPPLNHDSGGFANWTITPMTVGVGQTINWSGAHVYTPLKIEVYSGYAANKFVVRFYPTEAMAIADKSRPLGDAVPANIQVLNEFVVGGDLPAASYGTGGTVSSWTPAGTPRNVMFASYMQVSGTGSRFSATHVYRSIVYTQS